MSSHLLFIDSGAIDHSSLHVSHEEAWSSLASFVDENWALTLPTHSPPVERTARIEAFFAATGWFYLIAAISLERPESNEPAR